MTNYEKGRRGEYYVREKMQDWGFFCERFASSKPYDLIIVVGNRVWFAEVKSREMQHKEAYTILENMEDALWHYTGASPVVFYKHDGKWHYAIRHVSDHLWNGTLDEWREGNL